MTKARFALAFVRERLRLNLSQSELARRAGLSPCYVNHLERGRLMPHAKNLAKFVALGMDANFLLGAKRE